MTYWTYLIDTVAWVMGAGGVFMLCMSPAVFIADDLPRWIRIVWIPAAILFMIFGWSMVAYRGDGGVWF